MIINTNIISLPAHIDEKYGSLVAIEETRAIPFKIRRVYYIYGVPCGEERGFHSHNDLEQVLICVSGSVSITVNTPYEEETIVLDTPEKGLYIGPMVWRVMHDFSSDAVLLVLAVVSLRFLSNPRSKIPEDPRRCGTLPPTKGKRSLLIYGREWKPPPSGIFIFTENVLAASILKNRWRASWRLKKRASPRRPRSGWWQMCSIN